MNYRRRLIFIYYYFAYKYKKRLDKLGNHEEKELSSGSDPDELCGVGIPKIR